jgi:hypothetical protein
MTTLTIEVTKNIISRLIKAQDYRIEVVALINAQFLQFAIEFFGKIVQAKLQNEDILDWYKVSFLNPDLSADEIAINSGLNKKTIVNMFNSATKGIVIDAASQHYDILNQVISQLIEENTDIDITLTIKFNNVSVDLNINESLIVINTLAVKRAALRGGLWSTAGKKVEKPLMLTLCKLFDVPENNYAIHLKNSKTKVDILDFEREIDFYLINDDKNYKCEVKLMGKGNPESADVVIARDSAVFIADKLSDLNKIQLDSLHINWVELRSENGYQQFEQVLKNLNIPYQPLEEDIEQKLTKIFNTIFK